MDWQHTHKRFRVHDDLGYYRSYDTRRQAIQAIKDSGPALGSGIWQIIDSEDNSRSLFRNYGYRGMEEVE